MHKLLIIVSALLLLFLSANFRWVHAAVVVASATQEEICAQTLVSASRERLEQFYSGVQSSPWLVCLEEPRLGLGRGVGSTNFAPGLPSILIIGETGANVDVVAHEWSHAEFAERVGVISRTYVYPTWFDEGLAMQVDLREAYGLKALTELESEAALLPVKKENIANPSGFFKPGQQGRLHYAWSRREVATLLRRYTLAELLDKPSLVD